MSEIPAILLVLLGLMAMFAGSLILAGILSLVRFLGKKRKRKDKRQREFDFAQGR